MGLFNWGKKEEIIGAEYAAEMPSGLSPRQINKLLVNAAETAEQQGYSSEQADSIAGAAFRSYLVSEGKQGEYPEIYEEPKKSFLGKLFG